MTIEIYSIGGYEEVGKNMSVVKAGNQAVILDMGIYLDPMLLLEETGKKEPDEKSLRECGALPDDSVIKKFKDQVIAIVISHAHLDHCAAVQYLAKYYKAPIIGTPFTIEFLRNSMDKETFRKLKFVTMSGGEVLELGKFSIEFIHVTHSTPHTVHTAVHTPEGTVVYASDYKLDNTQVLSPPPDYKRMKRLGKDGIKAVIVESVRADEFHKTPGEVTAKELLRDTLNTTLNEDNGVIITSFSSHIERLNSIMEIAKEMDRKVSFCGRSMAKYIKVAEAVGVRKFPHQDIAGRQKAIGKVFETVSKNKAGNIIVSTGSQGEPNSVLSRLADGAYNYQFGKGDQVIFSSNTIPSPINIQNRHMLETKLISKGARVFRDVHVSGHAAREDHRDLINLLHPENLIPCHGHIQKLAAYANLASEEYNENKGQNYKLGEGVHLLRNGQKLVI